MDTNYRTANVQTVKKVWIYDSKKYAGQKVIKLYGSTTANQRAFLEKHFDKVYYKWIGRKHRTYNNPAITVEDDDEFANIYITYLYNQGYEIHLGDEVYCK